jgi:chromosome partitioning protein
MRQTEFKTSVALDLCGLDVSAKKLQELVGREKPKGQHHMRYTPADLRAARYRVAGYDNTDFEPSLFNTLKLPPVIVTRMTKGGVGKTCMAVNVAAALGMMGFRILLIDADPQASASNLLQGNGEDRVVSNHIGHFLLKKTDVPDDELKDAIIPIYEGGFLDLLPADITLAEADATLVTQMGSHERAFRFFAKNKDFLSRNYDAIIVDTAPGTTPVGLAFTFAAKADKKIISVVEPVGDCIRALESLSSNLAEIKSVTGAVVEMEIIINKYHPSLKHVKENMGVLYTKYGAMLNDTIIPQFSGFARQMDPNNKNSCPLVEGDPSSVGSKAMFDIAKSMIHTFAITHPGLNMVSNAEAA